MRRAWRWLAAWVEAIADEARWGFQRYVRNPWRRRVRFTGQDTDDCYFCDLAFPAKRMRAYASTDGNEHRICGECTAFVRILAASREAGVS